MDPTQVRSLQGVPGTYFVTIIDNYCNSTILSKTVTEGGVNDFISIEPLCTGKIRLSVGGFESVKWSTGSEETSIEVGVSGAYEAEATDEGCTSIDKVNVTVNGSCQAASVAALSASAVCSDFPSLLRRWKVNNPNTFKVRGDWEIAGTVEKTGSIFLQVNPSSLQLLFRLIKISLRFTGTTKKGNYKRSSKHQYQRSVQRHLLFHQLIMLEPGSEVK